MTGESGGSLSVTSGRNGCHVVVGLGRSKAWGYVSTRGSGSAPGPDAQEEVQLAASQPSLEMIGTSMPSACALAWRSVMYCASVLTAYSFSAWYRITEPP